VLRVEQHDHGGILAALGFVNRAGVGQHQFIEFALRVTDGLPVKQNDQRTVFLIHLLDEADVPVEDFFVVIVAQLHDTVIGPEVRATPHQRGAGGIERGLDHVV